MRRCVGCTCIKLRIDGSTRRRTNAYMFDRDLYAKWGGSAAVGNKDDDEGLSSSIAAIPQQSRSNVVGLAKPATSPDLANKSYNTHLDLSNTLSHSKSEITRKLVSTTTCSITSSRDICVAAGQDPKTENSEPGSEPEPHQPQNSPQQIEKPCCGLLEDKKSHAGELMADRRKIHAVDYKPLAIPEPHTPCCRRSTTVSCSCRFTGSRCLMSWMRPWEHSVFTSQPSFLPSHSPRFYPRIMLF